MKNATTEQIIVREELEYIGCGKYRVTRFNLIDGEWRQALRPWTISRETAMYEYGVC